MRPRAGIIEKAGIERVDDVGDEAETVEGGLCYDDSVDVRCPGQAGGDVSAQRLESQVGAPVGEVRPASDGSGGDPGAFGQVGKAATHECVARIAPFGDRCEEEAVRGEGREVLGRVDGEVGTAVQHGCLYLLHEDALTTHLLEGRGAIQVAGGCNDDEPDFDAGV